MGTAITELTTLLSDLEAAARTVPPHRSTILECVYLVEICLKNMKRILIELEGQVIPLVGKNKPRYSHHTDDMQLQDQLFDRRAGIQGTPEYNEDPAGVTLQVCLEKDYFRSLYRSTCVAPTLVSHKRLEVQKNVPHSTEYGENVMHFIVEFRLAVAEVASGLSSLWNFLDNLKGNVNPSFAVAVERLKSVYKTSK